MPTAGARVWGGGAACPPALFLPQGVVWGPGQLPEARGQAQGAPHRTAGRNTRCLAAPDGLCAPPSPPVRGRYLRKKVLELEVQTTRQAAQSALQRAGEQQGDQGEQSEPPRWATWVAQGGGSSACWPRHPPCLLVPAGVPLCRRVQPVVHQGRGAARGGRRARVRGRGPAQAHDPAAAAAVAPGWVRGAGGPHQRGVFAPGLRPNPCWRWRWCLALTTHTVHQNRCAAADKNPVLAELATEVTKLINEATAQAGL